MSGAMRSCRARLFETPDSPRTRPVIRLARSLAPRNGVDGRAYRTAPRRSNPAPELGESSSGAVHPVLSAQCASSGSIVRVRLPTCTDAEGDGCHLAEQNPPFKARAE